VQLDGAIHDGSHQVDASARAVGLVAGLDVGGTRTRTEAAVDAVEDQFVVELRLRGNGVDFGQRRAGAGGGGAHKDQDNEPQRHRDTEKRRQRFEKSFSVFSLSSLLCVSVSLWFPS